MPQWYAELGKKSRTKEEKTSGDSTPPNTHFTVLRCGKVILVVGLCEDVRQANAVIALAQATGSCNTKRTKLSVSKMSKGPPAYPMRCVLWLRSCSKASAWRVLSAKRAPARVWQNRWERL